MNKRILSTVLSLSLAATMCGGFATTASAAAKTPQYQATARLMEELNRGGFVAANPSSNVSTAGGVYLSWRLLGDESLDTCFNIYKNGTCIKSNLHNTNYIDTSGRTTDKYTVAPVVNGVEGAQSETFAAYTGTVESSWKNSPYAYFDIKTSTPPSGTGGCTYTENDASVGDVDGDGDYELILKWDPSNSKDSSKSGVTGHVYIDCYEMDPDGDGTPKWRIDLGGNIRAGAHYTQFQVFDYDGDGYAEVAIKTAPGTVDGTGKYVTAAGNTDKIRNADNSASYVGSNGHITGGPEYLTIFNGETGAAMQTIDYGAPLGDVRSWGDSTYNRSDRFLAGTAYLDGVHPSIIMARGYYKRAVVMAYDWDGTDLIPKWITDSSVSGNSKLAASGNHNLSVADLDNDGYDEIIYGSAAVDHDGKVMHSMGWGHGDALHVSDFDNDGEQEIFGALEGDPNWGVGFRTADGTEIWHKKASDDDGRGIMANFSEQYGVLAWDAAFGVMDIDGKVIVEPHENPNTGEMTTAMDNNQSYGNFNIYWDDDLLSEHYDKGRIQKWYDSSLSFGRLLELPNVTHNNGTKQNPCLQADLFGDWREELVMRKSDGTGVRVFTSLIPTNYMLTTLMHDSQYRCAIAWQNTGYNIPPHTSYFIGTESLATDASGNALNYLAPAVAYTNVTYEPPESIAVTGMTLQEDKVTVEKGESVTVNAVITPSDATKKGITWTSSDTSVATVSNGIIKGVGEGKATITATAKDTTNGTFTDTCEVTVYSSPVTGITLSDKVIELGVDYTAKLKATVYPTDATDKSVTWTSADPAVASVSSDGTVTGLSYGKTTVTATTNDGGLTASCIVKVKPIDIIDITGEDNFVTSNSDEETSVTVTNKSATATQTKATSSLEFHKDFDVYSDNKVKLSFHFTTGGAKEGSEYIWILGHAYTSELKLLDSTGNNILNILEEHTTSGVSTKYIKGTDEAKLASTWTKKAEAVNKNTAFNRSQVRWDVTVDFDYNNDVGTITLAGCDSSWTRDETWQYTFALNGAKFKTIQYDTKDITDYVSGSPKLENVSYTMSTTVTGNAEALYERGMDTAWSDADLTDWVQTGTDTAALALDSENGRVWYNATQPTAEYSASKTFSNIADDALVAYDVDWYFGSAVNRDGNFEYVQFGDKLRIGWTNGYVTWVSTDGGKTWNDKDKDGTTDSIFTGANATYTKNIKVIFDTKTNTIKSFKFDGNEISAYTNYALEGAAFDSVTFGFQRSGAAPTWAVPNGIDRIKVSQFVIGEEEPDFSAVKITDVNGNTVNVSYDLVDYNENVILIGALYDNGGELVEVKSSDYLITDDSMQHIRQGTYSFSFTNNAADYKLKVFMWDSLNGMIPISDAAK